MSLLLRPKMADWGLFIENEKMSNKTKDAIPLIPFKKKRNSEIEFEIVPLNQLFERNQLGKIETPIDKIHRVQFNQVIIIEEGCGTHWVDFREYEYQTGDVLLVCKNQVQAFSAMQPLSAWLILFTDSFYIEPFIPLMFKDVLIHLGRSFAQVKNAILTMDAEYKREDEKNPEILRHLLHTLILLIARETTNITTTDNLPILIVRFFEKLLSDMHQQRKAEYYANRLGCSYKHLNQTCQKFLNCSAKSVIDHAVILELKRQLATTNHSLKQIADEFHFEDDSNFLKYFKQRTQQTPKEFRLTFQK